MSTETETLISENTKKLTLNKTHQKPWHKITGLMFKSKKERVVVGRIDLKTKEYIPFDEEALRLANLWKYTIDPALVESSASEYESEEEDNGSEMIRDLVRSNHDVEPVKKTEQTNEESTESDSDDDDGESDSGDESEDEENEENEEVATKESSEPSGDDEDKRGRSVVIVEKREEVVKEEVVKEEVVREHKDKIEEDKKEMKKHFESPIGKLREEVEETILMVLQEKLNKLFDVIEEKTKENEKLSSEIVEVKKEKSDVEEKLQKTQKDYEKLNTKWKNLKEMFS